MQAFLESPPQVLELPSVLRILRVDEQWRYVTLQIKAHGSAPDNRRDWCMDNFGLNYVLRGRGVYTEASGLEHALTPGTLFQRLPQQTHSTVFDPGSNYAELFLVLDRTTAEQMRGLGLISPCPVLSVGPGVDVLEAFLALRHDLLRPETELPTRAALSRIIMFLGDLYEWARQAEAGDAWEGVIRQACVRLERDLGERIDMAEVAAALNVAYPTFRRHFRAAQGVSPGAYRVRCRLEQARYLLRDKPIKQVAAELGYSDTFAFSAQFKTHFGLSPRRFQHQSVSEPSVHS